MIIKYLGSTLTSLNSNTEGCRPLALIGEYLFFEFLLFSYSTRVKDAIKRQYKFPFFFLLIKVTPDK